MTGDREEAGGGGDGSEPSARDDGEGPSARGNAPEEVGVDDSTVSSVLFTYGAPFLGVLLVSIGIAAAVPGAYALIQEDITQCGSPTIAVETPEETRERFGSDPGPGITEVSFEDLSTGERAAFEAAIDDPVREAHVDGPFPRSDAFANGTIVAYEGESYFATVVADNPCFEAAPLQFPLGVFAIAFGGVGILTPPVYRRLVKLESELE